MKIFILENCPHCRKAIGLIDELYKEDSSYQEIDVEYIDEGVHPEIADQYDYYYVPTFYVNEEKVHEGIVTKEIIKEVFDKAKG